MIPTARECMQPLLQFLSDGEVHSLNECSEGVADYFRLSKSEREELQPNGKDTKIHFNVGWAKHYLRLDGLLVTVTRGHYQITEKGLRSLGIQKQEKSFLKWFKR